MDNGNIQYVMDQYNAGNIDNVINIISMINENNCHDTGNDKIIEWGVHYIQHIQHTQHILNDNKLRGIILDIMCKIINKFKFNTLLHKKITDCLANEKYLVGLFFKSKYAQKEKDSKIQLLHEKFSNEVLDSKIRDDDLDKDIIEHSIKVLNYPIVNNVKWLNDMMIERDRTYKYYEFSKHINRFTFLESPRNFSYVTENLIGSSIPNKEEHYELFSKLGITLIITLMETPLDKESQKFMEQYEIQSMHFTVNDREPMTIRQMIDIINAINADEKVLIHCLGGVGRTATALVAYFIVLGKTREDGLKLVEKRRTILSNSQDLFLKEWKNKFVSNQLDEINLVQKISPKIKLFPVIMLVGFPASGKSTFAKIISDQIRHIHRINQDEIRTKGLCEELFAKYSKSSKVGNCVILDRCNLTIAERKYWLGLNNSNDPSVWCVFFNCNIEECKWRIKNRGDHPTVKPDKGEKIIDSVSKTLQIPTIEEGFTKIDIVTSFKESNQLLLSIGCDISNLVELNHDDIIKFPRTKHLHNLGSASRDDLLLSGDEIEGFLNCMVYLEEKIDGANLGLSVKDNKIIAQNRSHYVNSAYHAQFKLLDKWIFDHSQDLWEILGDNTKVLYGEWVYAKHSIEYTDLPDYFIAFDIYDIVEQRFYSRSRVEKVLAPTSIRLIPIVKYDKFKNIQEMVNLIQSKSMFYDGRIEGVYVRKCNDMWLEDRGKIVRNDFICGNQHWAKNILIQNKIKS
jgi:atypical dual specificity phosphatase